MKLKIKESKIRMRYQTDTYSVIDDMGCDVGEIVYSFDAHSDFGPLATDITFGGRTYNLPCDCLECVLDLWEGKPTRHKTHYGEDE